MGNAASLNFRFLVPEDAEALTVLRKEALESHPLAFGASIQDDKSLSIDFVRASLADRQASAILGLFEGTELVGMVGVVREAKLKARHKVHIWGMYITPRARGRGAGRGLLEGAVEQARSWSGVEQIHLSVTEAAVEARRLYESAGFREWGREPRSLQWEGQVVDERHLVFDLR